MQTHIKAVILSQFTMIAALAGSPASGQSVPFKETSTGIISTTGFDAVHGVIFTHVEGEGDATHLGHYTVKADVSIDAATGIPTGDWTLTAADGDMLFVDMTGHGIDSLHGFGEFTIVGGTGRFRGATGYYEQIATFGIPLGTADIIPYLNVSFGTISYSH